MLLCESTRLSNLAAFREFISKVGAVLPLCSVDYFPIIANVYGNKYEIYKM